MKSSSSMRSLAEDIRKLTYYTRVCVLDKVEACEDKANVNGAVFVWLGELDQLIEDMNQDEYKTPEWCSNVREKIKTLNENANNFEPFYKCSTTTESTEPNPFLSPLAKPSNSIQDSSVESTSSRKFKHFKSKQKVQEQKLRVDKDDGRHSPNEKSTSTHAESISSLKFVSSNSSKDDVRQQLEPQKNLPPFASGNFGYCFDSMKVASEKILEALKDDNFYVIGLYGKRGSGKTMLVQAEIDKYKMIFDRVLFPTVSKNQDILSIQDGIANKLDVHFDRDDNDRVRSMKINSGFDRMDGTTLVILDGFPTMYKPQEVGIPYERKQCKVLLTTRDEADCIWMKCDHSILLEALSDDEAWTLLQKLSGVNSRSDMFNVAKKIAFNCSGLPGLIKDVASSLKKKSIHEWKESLVSLSHSTARYQIFISFRGGDTRHIFTKHLHHALCKEGFMTFKDDESLEGGVPIEKLLDDIEESRFAIVILSKNYAGSEWCLKELIKILECKNKEGKNQLVLPIFYEVPPTDVRHVRNSYADAMVKHEKNGKKSYTVKTWKKALYNVCTLTGFEKPHNWTRDQFIGKIVKFACDHRHRLHIQSMYVN